MLRVPPLVKSFSLAELTDVESFAKHQIGIMEDAMQLGDEVIRQVSHMYALMKYSETFPCADFCVNKRSFRSKKTALGPRYLYSQYP